MNIPDTSEFKWKQKYFTTKIEHFGSFQKFSRCILWFCHKISSLFSHSYFSWFYSILFTLFPYFHSQHTHSHLLSITHSILIYVSVDVFFIFSIHHLFHTLSQFFTFESLSKMFAQQTKTLLQDEKSL